jgi:thiamine pyridinylase
MSLLRALALGCVFLFLTGITAEAACLWHTQGSAASQSQQPNSLRTLRVVLYPAIPGFNAFKDQVKTRFEKRYPDVRLEIIDLTNNYYGAFSDDYIGCVQADVYELDSVFLHDFAINGKIQALPDVASEPIEGFLKNAQLGSIVNGVRYGSPHWVCGNFLFFAVSDLKMRDIKDLKKLATVIGDHPVPSRGIAVDFMGKSTLGEFYLNAAVDRFGDFIVAQQHIALFDQELEKDLFTIRDLCAGTICRDPKNHFSSIFAEQFASKQARALIGYSESLNGALRLGTDKNQCGNPGSCLSDQDIDVEELPLDEKGARAMSWVDSFVVDKKCKARCLDDAAAFIHFMNEDETYLSALLPADGIPAYLLPAKTSLYSRPELLSKAHLYPKLRSILEGSIVPSDLGLNERLRNTGRRLDADLSPHH